MLRRCQGRRHRPCRQQTPIVHPLPRWQCRPPSTRGWQHRRSRTTQWCRHHRTLKRCRDHRHRPCRQRTPIAASKAEVAMSAAVHEGLAAPSFSYHAMVSSPATLKRCQDRRHRPCRQHTPITCTVWPTWQCRPPSTTGSAAPSFSYQAMVSSPSDADDDVQVAVTVHVGNVHRNAPSADSWQCRPPSTKGRPHRRSRTRQWCRRFAMLKQRQDRRHRPCRQRGRFRPSAEVAMSAAVHDGLAAPSFSYQAMVSS